MKNRTFFRLFTGVFVLAVTVGCSGSDSDDIIEYAPKLLRLTITQTDKSDKARLSGETRATLTPSGNEELAASWTAGDELSYCNLSNLLNYQSGTLTANTTAANSSFTGNVYCNVNNTLAIVYPTTTFNVADYKLKPYTITLSGQDGTLATLASNFHYLYGVAKVKSATETTATAEMTKMKSLLTVCKFSFKEKGTDSNIKVKELTISFTNDGDGGNSGTYPQTATVTASENQTEVHASAVGSSEPLTVTLTEASTEVYVAMLPTTPGATEPRRFTFTVSDGSNTYTGKLKAFLEEGEYVEAAGLGLTKQ